MLWVILQHPAPVVPCLVVPCVVGYSSRPPPPRLLRREAWLGGGVTRVTVLTQERPGPGGGIPWGGEGPATRRRGTVN